MGYIVVESEHRPWWAFWRHRTVLVRCSEHGLIATRVPEIVTETGWDPAQSIVRLHLEQHT